MSGFYKLHPAAALCYFLSVMLITMFSANPVLTGLSLLGGILFFAAIHRNAGFYKDLGFYLVLFILISVTNPLFSHNGVTPLFFLNGNPVTLEAVLYGVDIAVMIIAVVYWFKCWNIIMGEDKLLYLFGRCSPKIALLLSSALRFVPLLKKQAQKIRQAQKAMGLYADDTWLNKLKAVIRVYSALITWALESAIDTGSSMKARGYGLKGRTHYSLFRFKLSDAVFLAATLVIDVIVIWVLAEGGLQISFYPYISAAPVSVHGIAAVAAFGLLSMLPFILEVKEDLQWKYYKSKI